MKIFFDKEFNIEFVYNDNEEVNVDANDFKVVSHGYDIDDDDYNIFNDEDIEELERMLNEGGATMAPLEDLDDDTYDGEPDWGRTGYGRFNWGDDDLGTYDETDGPPPIPKQDDADGNKKLSQAEIDALIKKHCKHNFIKSQGLYRMYSDCKHCGIKEEDFIASKGNKK